MSDYSDDAIAARLKALLDGRNLTVKSVAATIEVPYRALQGQLLGTNRMTASTLAKLLVLLQLPIEVITEGRLRPPLRPLANALRQTLGDALLPGLDENLGVIPPPPDRSEAELHRNAGSLAFLLREHLERETLEPSDWTVILAERTREPVSK